VSGVQGSARRRLILGFGSNLLSRFAASLIQLVQVPVFLHFWNVPLYGEWLIINSIPSYLSFSNIGFGSVAGNEMTMKAARDDREGALRSFQSCWWFIILSLGIVGAAMTLALVFVPHIGPRLRLSSISDRDARFILFYLGLSVLLGQLEQLLQSAYQCVGRYPYGSLLKSCFSLFAFACTIASVALGGNARTTAMAYALGNIGGTITLAILVRRDIPWIRYGWSHASFAEIRRISGPAIAFMGFPMGNALNLQGTLMAVQYALGPADVVIFGTARTVSRLALQMVQMVNSTFAPELSIAYGADNTSLLRTLHRRSVQMAIIIALVVITIMMTLGPWFLHHWTGGHVPPSRPLLAVLLLVVLMYSLWSTSSTVHSSINRHQGLAAWYIFGTGVTVIVTYFAAKHAGLMGAAASLVLSELIMNIYVLPQSLRFSHDTFGGFARSLFTFPAELHPRALADRIRRRRQPQLDN
jgi:O-antigen/teichoic acid export membrane protein